MEYFWIALFECFTVVYWENTLHTITGKESEQSRGSTQDLLFLCFPCREASSYCALLWRLFLSVQLQGLTKE